MWTAILKCHFHDTEEDEEEGSYGSEEGQDIKALMFRDLPFSPAITGPSTFSVVKLEANQKAKIKRERQELYGKGHQKAQWLAELTCSFDSNLLYFCDTHSGSHFRGVTDGDVKVKRKPPCRSIPIIVPKPPRVRRRPGRPRLQDKRWPGITGRTGHYRKTSSLLSFPSSSSERIKRATRKSSMLRVSNSVQWQNVFLSLGRLRYCIP